MLVWLRRGYLRTRSAFSFSGAGSRIVRCHTVSGERTVCHGRYPGGRAVAAVLHPAERRRHAPVTLLAIGGRAHRPFGIRLRSRLRGLRRTGFLVLIAEWLWYGGTIGYSLAVVACTRCSRPDCASRSRTERRAAIALCDAFLLAPSSGCQRPLRGASQRSQIGRPRQDP